MYSCYFTENCLINTNNNIFNNKISKNTDACCIYNIFAIHRPSETAMTPTMMLAMVYIEKCNSSPARSKECFSKAKVEKVVKPPQNPVASNKIWF